MGKEEDVIRKVWTLVITLFLAGNVSMLSYLVSTIHNVDKRVDVNAVNTSDMARRLSRVEDKLDEALHRR